MRDSQRSKVYKADKSLDQFSTKYDNLIACTHLVKRVWRMQRFKSAFPEAARLSPPSVIHRCLYRRTAWGGFWAINLPEWARTTGIVVHELAHTICARQYRHEGHPAHGWQFCEIYLKLTLYVMGREAHDALKAAFKENRVKYRPPRKRQITPEQRAVLVERMTAARLAKSKPKSRFAVLDLDA